MIASQFNKALLLVISLANNPVGIPQATEIVVVNWLITGLLLRLEQTFVTHHSYWVPGVKPVMFMEVAVVFPI